MSDYPNETVQDAANKLIAALALHEDARGTITDALHDMWDAGRETATRPDWWCAHHGEDGMNTDPEPWCHGCVEAGHTSAPPRPADLLRAIRSDAEAVRSGRALTRAVPAARIISHVEQLLTTLGHSDGQTQTPSADPDLLKFIDAAIIRALDLSLETADQQQRAQIGDWVAEARAAKDTRNAEEIRRLLATPYIHTGGQR